MSLVNYRGLTRIPGVAFVLSLLLSFALSFVPGSADAQAAGSGPLPSASTDRDEAGRRWIPSIAVNMGVTMQEWKGSHESTVFPGGTGPGEIIRSPDSDKDLDVTPFIGVSLELMTPELPIPIRSKPRLFVGGEIIPLFGFERTLAREGDPSEVASPLEPGQNLAFGEDFFRGQGAETLAEIQDIGWGAYAGISFPVEVFDRTVRIKPNVSWMRYRIAFKGIVNDGECLIEDDCEAAGGAIRIVNLEGGTSESFHGVGPGLDVELDTSLFDGIGSTVFVGFRAYRIVSDTDVQYEAREVYSDALGTGDVATARFDAKVDDWMYRLLFGFRLEWRGL